MRYFLVVFFCLGYTVNVVQAQQKTMYIASSNGVNMRAGAGTGHDVVAKIPGGYRVKVLEEDGDWAKVEYKGETGYVSQQFLSENRPKNSSSNNRSNSRSSTAKKSSGPNSFSYTWGVGFRGGDPLGVTVKKYLANDKALEFNLGSTSYWGFDYRDHFYDNDKFKDYDYLNHNRKSAIALQVHYLSQKDISGVDNLQWYWGYGGQIRIKTYEYAYRYRNYYGPGQGDYNWVHSSDKASDFDLGGDVVIGLEYHIPDVPLSLFLDVNAFIELLDDPFDLYSQAGLGIRYNFD